MKTARKTEWHYVYIVKCRNGELYTGYTANLESRLRLHNMGLASKFTRARLPVKLVHVEHYNERNTALKRELQIKRLRRHEKIELFSSKTV